MDEADKRRVLNAKLEMDLANEAAARKREAFHGVVHDLYYGPKRHGDTKELAELLGVTPTQVKRYADGKSSGNREPKRDAASGSEPGAETGKG